MVSFPSDDLLEGHLGFELGRAGMKGVGSIRVQESQAVASKTAIPPTCGSSCETGLPAACRIVSVGEGAWPALQHLNIANNRCVVVDMCEPLQGVEKGWAMWWPVAEMSIHPPRIGYRLRSCEEAGSILELPDTFVRIVFSMGIHQFVL